MTTRLGKAASFKRKAAAWLAAVAITLGCGTTAFANNSPENDYETDSTHILISEADTTIADIDNLMLGDAPSEVLGDKSLDGYSTLAVFSVTAVNDYDYSEIETTKIRGAAITSDMTVQVRFLPDDGDWTKIPFSVESGVLRAECETLHGCRTGEAKITKGYKLKAKYVIHTPGPIWRGGKWGEEDLLANCYRNCLALAKEYGVKSIAFPSISTGVYRFPIDLAAKIAVGEILHFLETDDTMEQIILVCFDEGTKAAYQKAFAELTA